MYAYWKYSIIFESIFDFPKLVCFFEVGIFMQRFLISFFLILFVVCVLSGCFVRNSNSEKFSADCQRHRHGD